MKARKVFWAVLLGRPVIGLLARTWRVVEENAEPFRAMRAEGRPYLLCAWHGELLVGLWANRHRGFSAMVSEHSDGEIITQVMAGWGFRAVRGSTSRGAMAALRGMVREISEGRGFAVTPDGPRGPAGVAQAGILLASNKARAPIAPMRIYAERAWRMKSWDRFMVPKPFSRIRVVYGEPWTAPGADEAAARELERRMGPAL